MRPLNWADIQAIRYLAKVTGSGLVLAREVWEGESKGDLNRALELLEARKKEFDTPPAVE